MSALVFSSTPKVLFFDFMGTCLDWHSSVSAGLPSRIPEHIRNDLAASWRSAFFKDIHARFEAGLPPEDIDVSHARLLDGICEREGLEMTDEEKNAAVRSWHSMKAWRDIGPSLDRLRRQGFEVFVLANGTTRLQLDLVRSSRLKYDMLFSSQLLGHSKPDRKIYDAARLLVGGRGDAELKPEECLMVAAHAYDLRAAKKLGWKTCYIQRTTEDLDEDMQVVRSEVDIFIEGVDGTETCGLAELATTLGA